MLRWVTRAGAILVVGLVAGCGGPKMGTVTGMVTVGGVPVKEGMIMFHPANGPTAVGTIKDGEYTLTTTKPGDGAVVGEHRVTITATAVTGGRMVEAKSIEEEAALSRKTDKVFVPGEVKWVVPEKYSQVETTDKTATVKEGPNTFDFDFPPAK